MIGAIAGDIIGSVYEARPIKTKEFTLFSPDCRFTDDSVLTIAVAEAIMTDGDYSQWIREIGRRYPQAGYGANFIRWLNSSAPEPYNSWGNGAAMRVSPVGWAFDNIDDVLRQAAHSAAISHDHPEGIKGAQAAALAVFLAKTTSNKTLVKSEVSERFGYDLNRTVESIRSSYGFDISCQGTVPEAIIAFLEADSYEDAVRNAVSLGGDSDTLACITGAIAEACFGPVAVGVLEKVRANLPADLWLITERFCRRFCGLPHKGQK
ncbi:MAG: ADP-ribosylglycohydrolase family protein [Thermodesulfobacteriota bacterium]